MDSESCTDAIQNQDEMGIDCGGTCPESCGTGRSNIFIIQGVKNDTPLRIPFTSTHYSYLTGDTLRNIARRNKRV